MSYQTLHATELAAMCARASVRILDCRDEHSYQQASLPGAEHVNDALLRRLLRSDRSQSVVVYCYHGITSRDIATFLVNAGFTSVYNLEGGWQAWAATQMRVHAELSTRVKWWLEDQGFEPDNLNSRIDNGMSALMQAALLAETDFAGQLLEAGMDVNLLNDDENNALWFACYSECMEIINMLIACGIDLDNTNVNGATCLIYAASAGKYNVVRKLVEAGANPDHQTLDGFSALDSASTLEVLKYLKQYCTAA